jgi:cytochrome c oxidase assembly protein subunit 15
VSSLRLAAHLGTAFLIYASMLWLALGLVTGLARRDPPRPARMHALALTAMVFVMVLTGALVAGIHAGSAYNTWPTMNGDFIPPGLWMIDPWWLNFVNNITLVQLDHRLLAYAIALAGWTLAWRVLREPVSRPLERRWAWALAIAVALQITAGITTLLLHVPLAVAAMHQAGALVVFTCALGLLHALTRTEELQR